MKLVLSQFEVNCAVKSIVECLEKRDIGNLCFISILKGGLYTTHLILQQLTEQIKKNILLGNLGLSSYQENINTEGKISITYPLDLTAEQLKNKNIWIIDDIFDSGLTMMHAKSIIKRKKGFNSIQTLTLVRKVNPEIKLFEKEEDLPDIIGFEYEGSGFLVGCGMGKGEQYRCLGQLYKLEPREI